LIIGIWDLPFDVAQGGEPVEPFVIWCLEFGIFMSVVEVLDIFLPDPIDFFSIHEWHVVPSL